MCFVPFSSKGFVVRARTSLCRVDHLQCFPLAIFALSRKRFTIDHSFLVHTQCFSLFRVQAFGKSLQHHSQDKRLRPGVVNVDGYEHVSKFNKVCPQKPFTNHRVFIAEIQCAITRRASSQMNTSHELIIKNKCKTIFIQMTSRPIRQWNP